MFWVKSNHIRYKRTLIGSQFHTPFVLAAVLSASSPCPAVLSSLVSLTCHAWRVGVAEAAIRTSGGGWVSVDRQNPFPLDHVKDTFRGIRLHPVLEVHPCHVQDARERRAGET